MNKSELFIELHKRYGAVKRARGCFLYTSKGVRVTDLYQEAGRAILPLSAAKHAQLAGGLAEGDAAAVPGTRRHGRSRRASAVPGTYPGRAGTLSFARRGLRGGVQQDLEGIDVLGAFPDLRIHRLRFHHRKRC